MAGIFSSAKKKILALIQIYNNKLQVAADSRATLAYQYSPMALKLESVIQLRSCNVKSAIQSKILRQIKYQWVLEWHRLSSRLSSRESCRDASIVICALWPYFLLRHISERHYLHQIFPGLFLFITSSFATLYCCVYAG